MRYKEAPKTCTMPISTIAYCTEEHLKGVIANMSVQHPNLRVVYCCHQGDTDDKKDHIHILIRTDAKRINNTDAIASYFKHEYDEQSYIIPFGTTKEDALSDWYEYVQHDPEYLESKGLTRNVTYTPEDVKGDEVLLARLRNSVEFKRTNSEMKDLEIITKGIQSGCTDFQIVERLPDINATNLYSALKGISQVRRTIDIKYDPDTAERLLYDYFIDIGLIDGIKRLTNEIYVNGKNICSVSLQDVKRFLAICIENIYTCDQLSYIFDGKITKA